MSRQRHTRDGTRRRDYRAPVDPRARFNPHAPRSDDDPAAEETAAEGFYDDAVAAAIAGDTSAWSTAVKNAARAAANARSGANSTGSATDEANAASAEVWAVLAGLVSFYTCTSAECRTRGGTATLCGFSEKTSASTPPKKYRRNTIAQDMYWCTYGSSPCVAGTVARFRVVVNGVASYDPSTCALTQVTRTNYGNDTGACVQPTNVASTSSVSNLVFDPAFMTNDVLTQTYQEVGFLGGGACYNYSGSNYVNAYGTGTSTLSEEDTEADAITRLLASASWSGWSAASSTSCLAKWEARTSGFDIDYQEAEFRATISIPDGVTGIVKVGVYRRAYGSADPFALYSTSIFSVTGDSSDEDTISMTVPNERGYETYAECLPVGS